MPDKEICKGCHSRPIGGIVDITKNWQVNQYWGSEGFLGWIALQPREHRMSVEELSGPELTEMGKAIQDVEKRLKAYWKTEWPNDPLERLYVTYFFESVFDNQPNEYHLHIHLIPRTKRMRSLITRQGSVNCWDIYKISKMDGFPEEYFRFEERVNKLMDWLRSTSPSLKKD